jgi:hypothetical protein
LSQDDRARIQAQLDQEREEREQELQEAELRQAEEQAQLAMGKRTKLLDTLRKFARRT